MNRFIITLLVICISIPANANDVLPLLYSRETVTITRKSLPIQPQFDNPQPIEPLVFDTEVRDANIYYNQKDWFSLGALGENSGLLLVFSSPMQSPIIPSKQYAPLDILLVNTQGDITQILPNIVLSNLTKQIIPQNPVIAFFFLNGNTCERLNIKLGDTINHKVFSKSPIIIGDPVMLQDAPQDSKPVPKLRIKKEQSKAEDKNKKLKNIPKLPPLPPAPSKGIIEKNTKRKD